MTLKKTALHSVCEPCLSRTYLRSTNCPFDFTWLNYFNELCSRDETACHLVPICFLSLSSSNIEARSQPVGCHPCWCRLIFDQVRAHFNLQLQVSTTIKTALGIISKNACYHDRVAVCVPDLLHSSRQQRQGMPHCYHLHSSMAHTISDRLRESC